MTKKKSKVFKVNIEDIEEHFRKWQESDEFRKYVEEQKERERKTWARAQTYWINT